MSNNRVLPLTHVHNFRDYGGYPTAGGGRVKMGLLWRSGHHAEASQADLERIDTLSLAHVIDLRGNGERSSHPITLPSSFAGKLLHFDGETAGLGPHMEAIEGTMNAEDARRAMERLYSALPGRRNLLWIIRRYFEAHPDDAMEDFLLTNSVGDQEARIAQSAATIRARYGAVDDETVRVVMGVDSRYLNAYRQALIAQYGSVEAFLEQALGVDAAQREALRLHLVET